MAMAPTPLTPTPRNEEEEVDATDFGMTKGNGVKGLSEMGLTTLPLQYVQPPEERFRTMSSSSSMLPIIDMSDDAAESICHAAQNWGVFQVMNHGVPPRVLHNTMAAAHWFFAMSPEEKSRFLKLNDNSASYSTDFCTSPEKALEWKDYLNLFYISDDHASACWPPVCRDEMVEYVKSSEGVVRRVLQILMKKLNVTKIDETKQSLLMGSNRIKLNYYPICPNPDLALGVGRHSDVSTVTVLLQDHIGGLHVRPPTHGGGGEDATWVHVSPVPGALVINIGDALQIMSNGRFKSVEHFVAANGSSNRISIPIFVNPEPSAIIGPLSEVLATGQKPEYKQVLYSDYVRHFYNNPHHGKNSIEFAKI